MKSFTLLLLIDKKDTSNDRKREMKCFRCWKSGHLSNNKICKFMSKNGPFCFRVPLKNKITMGNSNQEGCNILV